MDVTLVLQGGIWPETQSIVDSYLTLPWVKEIIVSCDEHWPDLQPQERFKQVRHTAPPNRGVGNRNLQIISSQLGLSLVTTEVAVKMRTDQIIRIPSMQMMHDFWEKYKGTDVKWENAHTAGDLTRTARKDEILNTELGHWWITNRNKNPKGRIGVCGLYTTFPFHPRDHVFWGYTEDLINLFNIPFDPYEGPADYNKITRAETAIGAYYFARANSKVIPMIENPADYLADAGIHRHEAMGIDAMYRERLFVAFPRIDMAWPKHGLATYHYDVGASQGQYWHEGEW